MRYKFAIIGYPITHSLSNYMQKVALKSVQMEGEYDVIETKPENLVDVVKKLKTSDYNGFNITIPFKVPIIFFTDKFDDYANLCGAVNTIKIEEDKTFSGYNTDVYGFINSLNVDVSNQKVAIIGTGGVARAIATAFYELKVKSIDLFSRNIVDSMNFANGLRNKFNGVEINLSQTEVLESLSGYKVVVNATPLGMKNFAENISPLTDSQIKSLDEDSLIYDVVYNPTKTMLIKQCEKFNKQYTGGLDMLVLQGARAFEIWTGQTPNIDAMKIEVLKNLM